MDADWIRLEYSRQKKEIERALQSYKDTQDYFYEMCFCLLTPQSNAFRCDACVNILKGKRFHDSDVDLPPILARHTRFHNTKSENLLRMKEQFAEIVGGLSEIPDAYGKREFLVSNVRGLGMKEASHFLRNIGHTALAILDRHILGHLASLHVIRSIPKSMSKQKYLAIEKAFISFGDKIGIPMDHLDLLFWSMETGRVFK